MSLRILSFCEKMTEEVSVLKVFESFVLGFCRCNCGQQIPLYDARRKKLRYFVSGHNSNGETNPNWNGGRTLSKDGYWYVRVPNHPYCNFGGYVLEHRMVVEARKGRYLLPEEVVHHINRIKTDNRSENLMLFPSHAEHTRYERTLDRTGCFCSLCGSRETRMERLISNGVLRPHWYGNERDGFLCRKCYRKELKKRKRITTN